MNSADSSEPNEYSDVVPGDDEHIILMNILLPSCSTSRLALISESDASSSSSSRFAVRGMWYIYLLMYASVGT
jgi:hypothetical protein